MIDAATNPVLLIAYHLWPDLYELHALAELASVEVRMDMLIPTLLTMCVFASWDLWLFSFFDLIILGVFAGPFALMTIIWIQSVTGIALAATVIPMLWRIARAQAAQRGPALTDIFS
ncbi:putative membrane protein [Sphingomonas leidyi]|uniref:Putative membrane protein n=1 Tax=Sphingomonas leidyi TaxID=68569 RepID=A0A7X5UY73_9SPHN|nr:hypothetical protein [Sphingomonas leidyi]NIJ63827.1 putative membrane protein [Sphingomonas leidyi]